MVTKKPVKPSTPAKKLKVPKKQQVISTKILADKW